MIWPFKKESKKKLATREQIIKQASNTAATKREEIGDQTLDKIRDALMKKDNSSMAQAKQKIMDMNQDKLRDNLKYWMREKE